MDLYKVLEVDINCSNKDIKKSYFRLAKVYHPDKNKDNIDKFHTIKYAYNILSNKKTREEYDRMNNIKKINLNSFLDKLFNSELKIEELKTFGVNITNDDFEYLENKFLNLFNEYNISDVFNLFTKNIVTKKEENDINCSDSEIQKYTEEFSEYYEIDNLPIKYQKYNENSILINLNVTIDDLFKNNLRKITIKRKKEGKFIKSSFEYYPIHPYIVFNEGGDIDNIDNGNLIIKLNLPKNYSWENNYINYNEDVSLYKYLYGDDFIFNITNEEIKILNWIPNNDGNLVKLNLETKYYKFQIKFSILLKILIKKY